MEGWGRKSRKSGKSRKSWKLSTSSKSKLIINEGVTLFTNGSIIASNTEHWLSGLNQFYPNWRIVVKYFPIPAGYYTTFQGSILVFGNLHLLHVLSLFVFLYQIFSNKCMFYTNHSCKIWKKFVWKCWWTSIQKK